MIISVMIKKIKNLIAFLTIFPVGMTEDCLSDSSNLMYLFPAVGALIGFLAGLLTFALLYIIPKLVTGILSCGFLLLLTGLHHTDGLLDFGDGLMCHGSPEEKIAVMHDTQTGTGGFMLGTLTVLATAISISQLKEHIIFQSLIVSETLAKLSMVILARFGKSAHRGMNTYFINAMHGNDKNLRLAASLAISLTVVLLCFNATGLLVVGVSLISVLIILQISNRHFNGITGDVMGASNDLVRMSSLLSILALTSAGCL